MLVLRRGLLFLVAIAGSAMLTLPVTRGTPLPIEPVTVDAFPPLVDRDSLAALLVSGPAPVRTAVGRDASEVVLDVIAAVDAIPSRSTRTSLLDEIAGAGEHDPEVVTTLARASMRLPSSSGRERVLRTIIQRQPHATGAARRAVLDGIRAFGASPDRASLLHLFVTRPEAGEQALADALSHVPQLWSSAERTRVLVAAARSHRIRGRARTAYVNAARGITSSRDRWRALSAISARIGEGSR